VHHVVHHVVHHGAPETAVHHGAPETRVSLVIAFRSMEEPVTMVP